MILYDYFRSTAAYRVRLALAIKGFEYEKRDVHLVKDGGVQNTADFRAMNPQGRVPVLVDGDVTLTQSLAIISYLGTQYPDSTPLLFGSAELQAHMRMITLTVACDIHPLNNLSVLQYLKNDLNVSDDQKTAWYHHWLKEGFDAVESLLKSWNWQGPYCFGEHVSIADVCLVPQVYNAHRFEFDMSVYPMICAINDYCLKQQCFQEAAP
jgi:maleylacetoacetate isomerase